MVLFNEIIYIKCEVGVVEVGRLDSIVWVWY